MTKIKEIRTILQVANDLMNGYNQDKLSRDIVNQLNCNILATMKEKIEEVLLKNEGE